MLIMESCRLALHARRVRSDKSCDPVYYLKTVARWTGAIAIIAFGMLDGCYRHREGVTETTIEGYGHEPFSLFSYG